MDQATAEQIVAQPDVDPAKYVVTGGPFHGKTLTEIATTAEGREYLRALISPAPKQTDLAVVVEENGQRILRLSPHPGQRRALESTKRFVTIIAGTQGGKALALDTPIPTPDGLVPMEDIHVGMTVLAADGTPCKVLAESEIFRDHRCWELVFDGGETIIADREHIWPIDNAEGGLLTTEEIARLMVNGFVPLISASNEYRFRRIDQIREISSVPTKCITVDSPDSLYLCGRSRIPTHNSVTGPVWLFNEIKAKGPGDYLVVSPTFTLLELKALPAFIKFFDKQMGLGRYVQTPVRRFEFSEEGERMMFGRYDPANPTVVYFAYAEDPESLESMTIKAAWLDEAGQKKFKLGSWQAILRRLAVNRGRALITTTPYDFGWLKTQIFDRYVAGEPDYDVINFKSTENPAFPQEEYDRAKATMPAWQHALFYDGEFRRAAGLIYDCFQPSTQSIPRFAIPRTWGRICGLDFGGTNTAATIFAEKPNTNELYLYRCYKAGGRTALEHSFYIQQGEPEFRVVAGGSRGEGQWRQEFRRGGTINGVEVPGLMVRKPAIADVRLGIMRVYGAFARNEIFIFDDQEDILEELETYSWELDQNQQPTGEIDDKGSFHFCFIAGTTILTDRGSIPIEAIRPGDMVLTRSGFHRVSEIGNRFSDQTIWSLETTDNRILYGTGDHPIWVENQGWKSLDTLRYNDRLNTVNSNEFVTESSSWLESKRKTEQSQQKTSFSKEFDIGAIPIHQSARSVFTSWAPMRNDCTSPSGNFITALCLMVVTFITRTRILLTTTLTILNVLRIEIISVTMLLLHLRRQKPVAKFTSIQLGISPKNGMLRRRGARGIRRMDVMSGKTASRPTRPVNDVEKCIKHDPVMDLNDSVRMPAKWPVVMRQAWTTKLENARHAEANSRSTNTLVQGIVHVNVRRVTDFGFRARVYNLTVENVHEYYANGILVSNCDSMRYVVGNVRGPDYEADIPLTPGLNNIRSQAEAIVDAEARRALIIKAQEDEKAREIAWRLEAEALDRARQRNPFDPSWGFR
jgi:hypothetical protein